MRRWCAPTAGGGEAPSPVGDGCTARAFRGEVLRAYQHTCAMCGLSRPELIEAAPIAAAAEPGRRLMVTNGLALCAMHRAAFDGQLVGVDPAGTIHVRGDVADEVDRPMLRPGLQALAGRPLRLPTRRRDHPDRDALEARFARFCRAEGAA